MKTANLVAAAVAVVTAVLVAPPRPAPAQATPSPVWWALGDSYSSGEGMPGTDAGPWGNAPDGKTCQRANGYTTGGDGRTASDARAWSLAAFDALYGADARGDDLTLTACTGNITDDWWSQYLQAQERSNVFHPDVVSFSFGGNNIGFGDVLLWCLSDLAAEILAPQGIDELLPMGCNVTEEEMRRRIDALAGNIDDRLPEGQLRLPQLYEEIARNTRPGGHVFVLGYPQLIEDPSRWPLANRFLGTCQGIDDQDASLWRTVIAYLNQQIALAVRTADEAAVNDVRFHWLDVSLVYENENERRGLCTSQGDPWLNGLTLSVTSGDRRHERSFHPHQEGHRATGQALAAFIASDVGDPTSLVVSREASYPAECGNITARYRSVDVSIAHDRIACSTARGVVAKYFSPDMEIEGSSAFAYFDGWECWIDTFPNQDGNHGTCTHESTGVEVGMRSAPPPEVQATIEAIRAAAEARDLDALVELSERNPDFTYSFGGAPNVRTEWESALNYGTDIYAELLAVTDTAPSVLDGRWVWPGHVVYDPCPEYGDPDCYYGYTVNVTDDGLWSAFIIGE